MKTIEEAPFKQLLEIISPSPALRIAHFAHGEEEIIAYLSDFAQAHDYEYQINTTDPDHATQLSKQFASHPSTKALHFPLQRPRYMMQGKLYDYLFVTTPIPPEIRSDFLQKSHSIIKNAGLILLFIPKTDSQTRYDWLACLEEQYYVASSTIDDLFEGVDLIISKKMHGWGG